ncbi:apolipoprotein N-acyltransferase [Haloferula sargassicola]|uniref:Apolipoprotein N-acyltransferase n=1 Tax=Haloferula sargassicola TaxID=490096 RepID=A0ABP9UNP8_9BACT
MIRLLLTLLAAGLGVLSFPPVHWHPLALVAPLPFLFAIRDAKSGAALGLGLVYGLALYIGTLNWLLAVFGSFALLLHFILALFPALFAGIWSGLRPHLPDRWWAPLAAAVLWTGIEHFRSEWFALRFAWITPGTGLPPGFLTPWIGVYGITLLIIAGCACIAFGPRFRLAGTLILLHTCLAAYLPKPPTPPGTLTVAAVQSEEMWAPSLLSQSEDLPHVDAIVWPEYGTDADLRLDTKLSERLQQLMTAKSSEIMVIGGRAELDGQRWQNTAFTLGREGVLGTHVKNRPVHFFDDGEPGTEAPAIPTPLGRIGTPICFDNDYAAVARRAVANGAEFLLIPSMDAEHWTARQHLQHAELFRHRAAENGRWLVVAASSGLTQAVDPRGRRTASLPLFKPGTLVTRISPISTLTPYQRGGWLIGPICTVAAMGMMIAAVGLPRLRGKTGP